MAMPPPASPLTPSPRHVWPSQAGSSSMHVFIVLLHTEGVQTAAEEEAAHQALFGCARNLARTHLEKKISHA